MFRKVYSPEFKAQVTKEAIETNNTALVARKDGVSQKTLYNWYSKEINKDTASAQTSSGSLILSMDISTERIVIFISSHLSMSLIANK